MFAFVFAVLVSMAGVGRAQQGSSARTEPGLTSSSYAVDNLETVNYFNGRLHFGLPLLKVGGRGGVQQDVMMVIDPQWPTEGKGCSTCYPPPSGGPAYSEMWAGRFDYEAGFGPGVMEAVVDGYVVWGLCGGGFGEDGNYEARTSLRFKSPDGTEVSFFDVLNDGKKMLVGDNCANYSNPNATLRGKVFVTKDGSAATFISDTDIYDSRYGAGAEARYFPSGMLKFRDGLRYRIDRGVVTWMEDRNGNRISYEYYPPVSPIAAPWPDLFPQRVKKITDPLGRQVNFTYDNPTGVATEHYDEMTYTGFGAQPRATRVYYSRLQNALRESQPIQDYCQLSVDCSYPSTGLANPLVVTSVVLPDGRSYQFRYNNYAELTRYVLPTGGAVEFDWGWGMHAPNYNTDTYRRVVQRRTYPSGGSGSAYESKTTYSTPEHVTQYWTGSNWGYNTWSDGYVDVDNIANVGGTETLLARARHYYYGWAGTPQNSGNSIDTSWKHGREYKVEMMGSDGSTVLRRVESTWAQTSPAWYTGSPDNAPTNNPRLVDTVTTLTDVSPNLVSRQTAVDPTNPAHIGFDQYNNQTDMWEFDFGAGGPGPLVRRTHTDYVTSAAYADAQTGAHIRNLPQQQWVSTDAAGSNKVSRTDYGYDQFGLNDCPGITGHDAAYSAGYNVRGNLTAVTRYADAAGGGGPTSSSTQYDIAGNPVSATDPNGHTSYLGYNDSFTDGVNWRNTYAFPTTTTSAVPDPAGQYASTSPITSSSVYDYSTGLVASVTDANGQTSSFDYTDPLDRIKQITRPDGGVTSYTYDRSLNAGVMNEYIRTLSSLDSSRSTESYQFYDGLGRLSRTFLNEGGSPAVFLTRDTRYDAFGKADMVSNPYRTAGSNDGTAPTKWTTTAYDALGRIKSVTTPDGAAVTTSYAGNTVTVTDQAGKRRAAVSDSLGRLSSVTEDPGGLNYVTTYLYDALGNLRKVDQGGQLRFFMYDSLSRLIRVKNPEQAAGSVVSNITDPVTGNSQWSMANGYDNAGNMTARVDARGVSINYGFDALNRNTTVRYTDSVLGAAYHTKDIDRHYDGAINGKGRFYYYNWDPSNNARFDTHLAIDEYDPVGRVKKYRQHFLVNGSPTQQFLVSRTYDKAGNVTAQTYPSGRTVSYSYDAAGRLSDFTGNLGDGVPRTYATGVGYDEFGGIRREQFGTQTPLYHKLRYNSRGQLYDVRLSTGSDTETWNRGMLINHYGNGDFNAWGASGTDNNGNVLRSHHYIPNDEQASSYTVFYQDYVYDPLNRMARVTETSSINWQATYVQQYDYDRWGNRSINAPQSWGSPEPQFDMAEAQYNNRVYAPGDTGLAMSQRRMQYDAAGNLTFDNYTGAGGRAYDAEGRMVAAADVYGSTTTYTYDANGSRVKRTTANQETWEVYGIDGELLAEYEAGAAPFVASKEYGYRGKELLVTMASGDPQRLRRFVKNLYYNAYARDASASELQQKTDTLAQAGVQGESQLVASARSVARGMFESSEYAARNRDNAQYVTDLYNAYLQRGPDAGGLSFWVQNTNTYGRGATLNAFEVSTEFATLASTLYGTTSGGDNQRVDHFVQLFYQGAFQRDPTTAEMQQQEQRLNNAAAVSQSQVITEAQNMGAELFVSTNYNGSHTDQQYVTDLYEAFLQRAPDGPGLNFWVQNTQTYGRAATLNAFKASTEYRELAGTLYRETFWLVADHVGTPRMVVYKTGSLAGVRRHDYLPFGEELLAGTGGRAVSQGYNADDAVRQKFTGKERDGETALDFFGFRYYSSAMGRFTSVDTMGGKVLSPQTQNLYEYVRNNPLRWIDPTGHWMTDPNDPHHDPVNVIPLVTPLPEGAVSVTIGEFKVVEETPTELPPSWHDVVPVWGGFRRLLFYNHTGQPERALGAFYTASVEGAGFVYGLLGRGSIAVVQVTERAVVKEVVAESGATVAEGATEAGQSVYRGVHAGHPAMDAALEGRVVPGNPLGNVAAEAHNAGGVAAESQFTSWTHDYTVAEGMANRMGPGGVILELPVGAPPPGATWRWVWSPDVWHESEVLLEGVREGAKVIRP